MKNQRDGWSIFHFRSNGDQHASNPQEAVGYKPSADQVIIQMPCHAEPLPQSPVTCHPEENSSFPREGSAGEPQTTPLLPHGQGGSSSQAPLDAMIIQMTDSDE